MTAQTKPAALCWGLSTLLQSSSVLLLQTAAHSKTAALNPCPGVSFTSLQGSSARPVRVVDIPGHPRVRGKFESHLDRARGVVFVVDSVDFMPKKTETAE